jgi:hypothetical protein
MVMPRFLRRLRARIKYRNFQKDVAQELAVHRAMAEAAAKDAGGRTAIRAGHALCAASHATKSGIHDRVRASPRVPDSRLWRAWRCERNGTRLILLA